MRELKVNTWEKKPGESKKGNEGNTGESGKGGCGAGHWTKQQPGVA